MDTCRREGTLRSFRRVEHPVTTSPQLCRALVAAALQGLWLKEKSGGGRGGEKGEKREGRNGIKDGKLRI